MLAASTVLLTACGGSSGGTPVSAPTGAAAATGGAGTVGQATFPGAAGLVAAIDGSTMQVQSQTGQVAVTWTTATTFTRTVAATLDDVEVGSCVTVRPTAGGSAEASATGPVAAESVAVTDPVDGECTAGFGVGGPGGRLGNRPSGAPTRLPSGAPSGGPTGAPGTTRAFGSPPVAGRVTAVDGGTLTVAAVRFDRRTPASGSPAPSPTASPTTTPVTVTTSGATTYSRTVPGTAGDLAVGQCVTAVGDADDTGAVTARSVSSRPATDGTCDAGPGGPPASTTVGD